MSIGTILKSPAGKDYFFNARFDEIILEVVKKYSLPTSRTGEFLELITAVLDEKISVADMPGLITEAFGVTQEQATEVSLALAGQALLPLTRFIPSIEAGIKSLGGKLENYPSIRIDNTPQAIPVAPAPVPKSLPEVLEELELDFDDVHLKRLEFLLKQYAKNEKTQEALKTFFTRSSSIGGLALSNQEAEELLKAALPLAASFLEEVKPVAPLATEWPEASVAEASVRQPTANTHEITVAPSHELMLEPEPQDSQKAIPAPAANTSPATSAAIDAAAKHVVTPVVADAASKPISQTSSKPSVPAPKPMAVPEVVIDKGELKAPAKKAEEAKKINAPIQDSFTAAVVLATDKARETLKKIKVSEKVFADLADKAIRGVRDIYQTRDLAERDLKVKGADLAVLMQAVTAGIDAYHVASKAAAVPPPGTPVVAKQPAAAHEAERLDQKFVELTKSAPDKLVPPAKAQLTVGSTSVQTPEGQRKVVDVVNGPRLTGPIEQLGGMTPTEFRRLSSNPTEACQKIEDLLATLESTAYEDRVKGVLAWRESPMNQLYLHIAEEALAQGVALPEISSRRRSTGQESLSPAEMKALALLNESIRF